MDLTQALGRPLGAMPERELTRWIVYANRKGLWFRRLELALAKLEMRIEVCMGGATNVCIADYLIDNIFQSESAEPPTEDEIAAVFGPRKQKVIDNG